MTKELLALRMGERNRIEQKIQKTLMQLSELQQQKIYYTSVQKELKVILEETDKSIKQYNKAYRKSIITRPYLLQQADTFVRFNFIDLIYIILNDFRIFF